MQNRIVFSVVGALAILFLISTASYAKNSFKAGAAKRIITPNPLLPVSGGVGTPEPTTEKKGELSVRALVLERDGNRVALVNIDMLGWPKYWGDKTRALVDRIPPQQILIGATHTHSAPDAYAFRDMKGKHYADLDYLNWVCVQMADAINEAMDALQPAGLKIGVDEAKGKIAYNYYAPDLYDPRCSVLQAISATQGNVIATLVNYAAHPEVIGESEGILSPDFCGPLYDRIEAQVGGIALFFAGALGGMVTADNRTENGDARTWEECIRIGELLADEALRIVKEAPLQTDPVLYCAARDITFPIDSKLMRLVLRNSPLTQEQGRSAETLTTQLNLVNIGTAQLLTLPGEVLPNLGYYLKRNMPTPHAFLLGLTNDAFGYIMSKYDFNSFKRYDYISRTSLGEMTGEILVAQSLQLIAESPPPDTPK